MQKSSNIFSQKYYKESRYERFIHIETWRRRIKKAL